MNMPKVQRFHAWKYTGDHNNGQWSKSKLSHADIELVRAADYDALVAKLTDVEAMNKNQTAMLRQADKRGDDWKARAESAEADLTAARAALEEAEERIEELEAACEVVSSEFEGELWQACRCILKKTGFDFSNADGVQAADFEEHMADVLAERDESRAALVTARNEALEEAAKVAVDYGKVQYSANIERHPQYASDAADDALEIANAIRALATPVSVIDDTAPTLWRDMTEAQKGALLLAIHEGKVVEARGDATSGEWKAMTNGVYLLDDCAYRIRALPIEEFSQACGIFDTHEVEDPLDLLFYQVQDPKYFIHDSNLPAMTTILHKVCQNDDARFDEATRLITLFMQAAYEKGKSDQ